jgi:putative addiction module component (TIGR02574 family)
MSREQIRYAALALAPADRAALAAELLESLDEPSDDGVEAAWEAEIDRRLDEVERGTAQTVSAEEVFRRMGRTFPGR